MSRHRTRARKYVRLRERLAAAYAMLLPQQQRDDLRTRKVPAKTVLALFTDDHNELHALGGSDRWFNLTPMLRAPHKEKSRRDTSIVAKVDRLSAAHEEHRRKMLAPRIRKGGHNPPPVNFRRPDPPPPFRPRPIPSRPFSKSYRRDAILAYLSKLVSGDR